jgi:FAD/FMN-containing dehydrogenase/Fe-S oxidoreductase
VQSLAADLRTHVRGEVRFDDGSRALYATDASNYRQVPIGVVVPHDAEDIVAAVAAARRHEAPVLMRGGGTSLAGQCCNVAVVIDTSKYLHRVLDLDPHRRRASVEPGTILDTLRRAAAPHQLTFGPDPATHDHCTLGGMIGNNSCGVHALLSEFYGPGPTTADHVEALEVLTYDGTRITLGGTTSEEEFARIVRAGGRRAAIYRSLRALVDRYADTIRGRFPNIQRRVSGYNLPALLPENGFNVARALVGSESTCAITLRATVSLIPKPGGRALLVLGYPSVYQAADHVMEIRAHKPIGLEGLDDKLIGYMRKKGLHARDAALLPEGRGWLLVEFGGTDRDAASTRAREVKEALAHLPNAPAMRLYDDPSDEKKIWEVRESGLGATAFVPGQPDAWPGWEDAGIPVEKVGGYLRDFRKLLDRYHYDCALYGHFGQGCIHCRIEFDLTTKDGVRRYGRFTHEAAELVVRYGGSLSGEHGDGQSRGDLLPIMFGGELMRAFREFKSIWDPDWRMNPGKVIDANSRTADLRLGADYGPATPATHFQFPEDGGSFAHATLRCVGVGKCRRLDGGTMCPSFMVLREEEHTTRGRAHLLFEMLRGEELRGGWRNEAVKDALDLCLACKGCKGDCPVNVDMATYKAEFLSHYFAGRLRPRSAYAFGLIYWWARLAALAPRTVNAATHAPGLAVLAKIAAGMPNARRIPEFAPHTFRSWFQARPAPRADGRPEALLWPDTFTDHFHPEVGEAAVEVLEDAGYRVVIPPRSLCCGRPLYDYGMLTLAKRLLRQTLVTLRPQIEAGVPVVGLEPSCIAVFRDEMPNLLPHNEDAKRLRAQTFLLSELLERGSPRYRPPKLSRHALVQAHCHHRAVIKMEAEESLLKKIGLEAEILDSGCCGMAGSFGFERDKYEVSMRAGERVLLPAVRAAAAETLIVADGFSCREQIAQSTPRRALHLAQVLQLALRQGGRGARARTLAERARLRLRVRAWARRAMTAGALLAISAVLGRRARR